MREENEQEEAGHTLEEIREQCVPQPNASDFVLDKTECVWGTVASMI